MKFHISSYLLCIVATMSSTKRDAATAFSASAAPESSTSSGSSVSSNTAGKYLSSIPMGAPDAILGIAEAFKSCTDPSKVNVCVGAYRDATGKPWILPSVREAEKRMLDDPTVTKEYASIAGDARYVELALRFAYGQEANMDVVAGVQSLSGTGACRVGGRFFARFVGEGTPIYIPDPTW